MLDDVDLVYHFIASWGDDLVVDEGSLVDDSQPRDTLEQEFGGIYEDVVEDVATSDPYL